MLKVYIELVLKLNYEVFLSRMPNIDDIHKEINSQMLIYKY